MSQAIELQLTCPQCNTEFSGPGHTVVDMGEEADSEVLWQLQNGTLNRVECPNCGSGGLIPIPVALHNPENELLLVFAPGAQQIDEEQLGQVIGPVLQAFITNLPEERQAEYMMRPIVTDDPTALQAAARGEISPSDLMDGVDYEDDEEYEDDEDDEDDEELSLEEQQALTARMELLQSLFQASDSLERISMLRDNKPLVDDMMLEVIAMLNEQADGQGQTELVGLLRKIMNEVEVFIASNPNPNAPSW